MNTIFDDPTVKLVYDPARKQLIQKWIGFAISEKFREAIDCTVDFVSKNQVESIISDTLEQKVVKPEDTKYASAVMPQLFQRGLKKMAFVMPKDVLTQMSVNSFKKDSTDMQGLNFFSNVNDAQNWIG